MYGYIYIIKNDINDKVYIGKTLLPSIEERFQEHIHESKRQHRQHRPLYNAMHKYGVEHFYIELLEQCDVSLLSQQEQYWINYYSSYSKGYNATLGGDGTVRYNYQELVNAYLEGKLIKEIAEEFECDTDTVRKALINSGIKDTQSNQRLRNSKSLQMIDKNTGEVLYTFIKIEDAAQWIIDNDKSQGKLRSVGALIGRAAKKERKTAYGYEWTFV